MPNNKRTLSMTKKGHPKSSHDYSDDDEDDLDDLPALESAVISSSAAAAITAHHHSRSSRVSKVDPNAPESCLHCHSSHNDVQVKCDECANFICTACHWCHEFQANHEIRVCDRCDAFYCKACDEMDQCDDCHEVVCGSCSTLLSCKFCGGGLCEECATACGLCGIVLCSRDAKFAVDCDTCRLSYCLVCLASGSKEPCVRCGHRPSKRMEQLVHLRLKSIYKAFKSTSSSNSSASPLSPRRMRENDEPLDHVAVAADNPEFLLAAASAAAKNHVSNIAASGDHHHHSSSIGHLHHSSSTHHAAAARLGSREHSTNILSSSRERVERMQQEKAAADAAAAALLAELDEEEEAEKNKKTKKKKKKDKKLQAKKDAAADDDDDGTEDDAKPAAVNSSRHDDSSTDAPANSRAARDGTHIVGPNSVTPPLPAPNAMVEMRENETDPYDEEFYQLVEDEDVEGLEDLLASVKGVPGHAMLRKNVKKALKRLRVADEPEMEEATPPAPAPVPASNHKAAATTTTNAELEARASSPLEAGQKPAEITWLVQDLLRMQSYTHSLTPAQLTGNGTFKNLAPGAKVSECVMQMASKIAGFVIGKGGQRIRDLMEESGARIWIEKEGPVKHETRAVYISGPRRNVETANKLLQDLVSRSPSAVAMLPVKPAAVPSELSVLSDTKVAGTPSGKLQLQSESVARAVGGDSPKVTKTPRAPPHSPPSSLIMAADNQSTVSASSSLSSTPEPSTASISKPSFSDRLPGPLLPPVANSSHLIGSSQLAQRSPNGIRHANPIGGPSIPGRNTTQDALYGVGIQPSGFLSPSAPLKTVTERGGLPSDGGGGLYDSAPGSTFGAMSPPPLVSSGHRHHSISVHEQSAFRQTEPLNFPPRSSSVPQHSLFSDANGLDAGPLHPSHMWDNPSARQHQTPAAQQPPAPDFRLDAAVDFLEHSKSPPSATLSDAIGLSNGLPPGVASNGLGFDHRLTTSNPLVPSAIKAESDMVDSLFGPQDAMKDNALLTGLHGLTINNNGLGSGLWDGGTNLSQEASPAQNQASSFGNDTDESANRQSGQLFGGLGPHDQSRFAWGGPMNGR